jgi:hypothetical protein
MHRSIALGWALVLRAFKKLEEAEMGVGVGVEEEETQARTTSRDIGAREGETMESEFLRCLGTTGDGN